MAGYTRQSVADIINGLEVTAPPLNAEFNQVASAFDASSGHLHDGSTGNAPKINLSTSVDGYLPADHGGVGGRNKTDATSNPTVTNDVGEGYAPGSLWLNTSTGRVFTCVGNAAGAAIWREAAQITENGVFFPETNDTVDLGTTAERFKDLYLSGTADIEGNAAVGGNLSVSGNTDLSSVTVSGVASLPTVNIDGGNIDGAVVGNAAPAAITGTIVTANTGFTGDLTGNVTGNLTGNVTGDVSGNLTGDVTGDVASSGTSTFQNVTINGSLDMNAGTAATVTGLSAPVNATDAATKGYVDQEVSAVIDAAPGALDTLNELSAALNDDADFATTVNNSIATKVSKAGDTMTGQLDMGANRVVNVATPTAGSDATTKAYVDGVDAAKLDLSGGTMTGNIVMGPNKVTSTANPTTDDELARKAYVDSILGSATEAATSAANAATSETNAAASEANAATSEANAAASFDSFDDRYLGAKSTAPATDNDGDPLIEGAIYWNTLSKNLFIWDGSAWAAAVFDTAGAMFGVNNLSDVDDAAASRANLGLDTAATQPATAFATSAQGSLADTAVQPADLGTKVNLTSSTGSAVLPAGTTAERDASPAAGYLRFNADAAAFEGYDGTDWGQLGGASVNLSGATEVYVTQEKTYTITDYSAFSTYAVSAALGTAAISGETISYTAPASAGSETITVTRDGQDVDFALTISPAGVATPTHVAPADGANDIGGTVTLQSSAFDWVGISDTHASSDWQIATDAGFTNIVSSTTADATNLTSWEVTGLTESQTYYWRVRHTGANNGTSDWSTATTFTTAATFVGLIGVAGEQGFGVGEYPDTLPAGFSNLAGNDDPANANYGNYQYSDGSIMVFVPRFYYRIGDAGSPNYATYGANSIDIAGIDTFADEASANASGYALHRAFIDGGDVKHGFFIDKYLCSQNAGLDAGKSVQNGVPISLTDNTNYTRSDSMMGCTGILADSVVLSRARGAGFNVASAFMYSALNLLALAHGQAATSATNCAWYDGTDTTNFPKGCNSSLADIDDGTVTFTTAGDSGNADKPLTGSASNLAKTAHNGQDCGIVDINGAMWEAMLGVTAPGADATDSTQIANGDLYVLKESVALGDLTSGFGGTNDAWGDATHLGTLYDAEAGLMVWGSATGWVYLGSGSNEVFDPATSGQSYQRTSVGLPAATTSYDATGTNLFGVDGCYRYNRANLFPLVGGDWFTGSDAGLGARFWYYFRSSGDSDRGFRAAAYGS